MENKVQTTIFLSQWYPELQIRTDRCSAVRESRNVSLKPNYALLISKKMTTNNEFCWLSIKYATLHTLRLHPCHVTNDCSNRNDGSTTSKMSYTLSMQQRHQTSLVLHWNRIGVKHPCWHKDPVCHQHALSTFQTCWFEQATGATSCQLFYHQHTATLFPRWVVSEGGCVRELRIEA